MKDQLLQELSVLHEKVASIKIFDSENANLLRHYGKEFEALLHKLTTFNSEKFTDAAAAYLHTSNQNTTLDVHDDTDNSAGFYDSVAHLNNGINDAIETVNGL